MGSVFVSLSHRGYNWLLPNRLATEAFYFFSIWTLVGKAWYIIIIDVKGKNIGINPCLPPLKLWITWNTRWITTKLFSEGVRVLMSHAASVFFSFFHLTECLPVQASEIFDGSSTSAVKFSGTCFFQQRTSVSPWRFSSYVSPTGWLGSTLSSTSISSSHLADSHET